MNFGNLSFFTLSFEFFREEERSEIPVAKQKNNFGMVKSTSRNQSIWNLKQAE
jgi:hypothetical protein